MRRQFRSWSGIDTGGTLPRSTDAHGYDNYDCVMNTFNAFRIEIMQHFSKLLLPNTSATALYRNAWHQ